LGGGRGRGEVSDTDDDYGWKSNELYFL